jgi:hypothetical protein
MEWTRAWAASLPALDACEGVGEALALLAQRQLDRLPLPGAGHTLQRWQALSHVAAHDLSLAKLFEGHTDALAILDELGTPIVMRRADEPALWGTWCAEPPAARLTLQGAHDARPDEPVRLRLTGRKAWCSGAHDLSHALVSGWTEDGRPVLAAVDLLQPGVRVTQEGWRAVGMQATRSVEVAFDDAEGWQVGAPGDYTARPGFWRGGAGIAACWWGGAWGLARDARHALRQAASTAPSGAGIDPRLVHLGAIDTALAACAALLRETAHEIDRLACAAGDAGATSGCGALHTLALRARLAAETCADTVVAQAVRALGAGPLCQDARVACLVADLPVFVRQSHGARDQAALGAQLARQLQEPAAWPL